MDNRGLFLAAPLILAACISEPTDSARETSSEDSAADTAAGCNDGMTKQEWLDAWNLSFCTWAVACAQPAYGDSMERCYELTAGKADRCIDECRTAAALAAMQAHEASGSCEGVPDEGAVPFCAE